MNKIVLGLLAALSLITLNAHAAVVGEEVQYKVGDSSFKGYIAYDNSSKAKRPGVLVVHEW